MAKRIISFIYSAEIAYTVELGQYYMRFYYNGDLITSIDSPYTESEAFELQVFQLADVMRIVHYNHKPYKLSRVTPTEFRLEEIDFRTGPFMTRNDIADFLNPNPTEVECSVTEVDDIGTLISSVPIFNEDCVGSLYKIIHQKQTQKVTLSGAGTGNSTAMYVRGNWRFVTEGTWSGTVKIQRAEFGKDFEDYRTYEVIRSGSRNISEAAIEDDFNVQYRIRREATAAGFAASLTSVDNFTEGIVRVIGYGGPTSAIVEVLTRLESTEPTARWAEGAWNNVRGWPSTITMFEDRAIYSGATNPSLAAVGAELDYPSLREIDF